MIERIQQALRLLADQVNKLADSIKHKPDAYYGTVQSVSDTQALVVIDGSESATPCALQCTAQAGDRVTVLRRGVSMVAISREGGDSGGGSIDLPLSVANGGTGATNATDALTNLGAQAALTLPLALAQGGTGATTADGALTNLGVADWVVEEGTEGIWTYRKWDSGVAECWGRLLQQVTAWGTWGSMYEATPAFQATYPSGLFVDEPHVHADPRNSAGIAGIEYYQYGTSTQTPQLLLLRPSSGSTGWYGVDMLAIGRWK